MKKLFILVASACALLSCESSQSFYGTWKNKYGCDIYIAKDNKIHKYNPIVPEMDCYESFTYRQLDFDTYELTINHVYSDSEGWDADIHRVDTIRMKGTKLYYKNHYSKYDGEEYIVYTRTISTNF